MTAMSLLAFPPQHRVESGRRDSRQVAAQRGGASAAVVSADTSDDSGDRGAVVRVPEHRQPGGRCHLSELGDSSPGDAVLTATKIGLLGG